MASSEVLMVIKANVVGALEGLKKVEASFYQYTKNINTNLDGINKKLRDTENLRGTLSNVGRTLTTIFAGSVLAVGAAVKVGGDFEERMRNVNSIAKLSDEEFKKLSETVNQMEGNSLELAEGLYDVYSSGFLGADALNVLQVSADGAKAGLSDVATSGKALMGVLNAYGKPASEANAVMDIMFQTVNKGVLTFSDLAGGIGQVISTAAAANVSFEEVGAAIATLTVKGVTPAQSMTALNQVLLQIIAPSEQAKKVMKELGFEINATTLAEDGLYNTLIKAAKAADGNMEATAQLFGSVDALKGALSLTNDEGKIFNTNLDAMRESAGATKSSLSEQEKGLNYQLRELMNKLRSIANTFTQDLAPALDGVIKKLDNVAESFKKMPKPVRTVIEVTGEIAGALLGLGTVIIWITNKILGSKESFAFWGNTIKSIITTVVAFLSNLNIYAKIVVAAITALALAWSTNFLQIRDVTKFYIDKIKDAFENLKLYLLNIKLPIINIPVSIRFIAPPGEMISKAPAHLFPSDKLDENLMSAIKVDMAPVKENIKSIFKPEKEQDDSGSSGDTGGGGGKSLAERLSDWKKFYADLQIEQLRASGDQYNATIKQLEKEKAEKQKQAKELALTHRDYTAAKKSIDDWYDAEKKKAENDKLKREKEIGDRIFSIQSDLAIRQAELAGDQEEVLALQTQETLRKKIDELKASGMKEVEIQKQIENEKNIATQEYQKKLDNLRKQQTEESQIKTEEEINNAIAVHEYNLKLKKESLNAELAYIRQSIENQNISDEFKRGLVIRYGELTQQQITNEMGLDQEKTEQELLNIQSVLEAKLAQYEAMTILSDADRAAMEAIKAKLEEVHNLIKSKQNEQLKQFQDIFKSFLVNTLKANQSFADTFKQLWDSIKNAFISQIAEMIIQTQAFQAVLNGLSGLFGGIFSFHSGGEVGIAGEPTIMHSGGPVRRYHSGGSPLASDEVPAILQVGEYVVPRPLVQAMKRESISAGRGDINITITGNTFDSEDRINDAVFKLKNEIIYSMAGA